MDNPRIVLIHSWSMSVATALTFKCYLSCLSTGNVFGMDSNLANFMPVFKKNYLVFGLPDEAIHEIAELAEYRVAVAGDSLLTKGEKSSDLYVILEGHVNIYGPQGDKISMVDPPSILGEIALVDDLERTATATCVGLVKCARLPGKELRKYMGAKKEYGFVMLSNLARVLSMRLRNTNVVLLDLMGKNHDYFKHVT
jgi:CRP/FNR family cyclic AMP-dependent transcriptional regulator